MSLIIPPKPVILKVFLPRRLWSEPVTVRTGVLQVFCVPTGDSFLFRLFWLRGTDARSSRLRGRGRMVRPQRNGHGPARLLEGFASPCLPCTCPSWPASSTKHCFFSLLVSNSEAPPPLHSTSSRCPSIYRFTFPAKITVPARLRF